MTNVGAPSGPSQVERAGFVSRAAALFVDATIVALGLRGTAWLLGGLGRALRRFAPPVDFHALLLAGVPLLVAVYLVAFWTLLGQTPGKWLMGLKIIPIGGGELTFRRAVVRLVGYVLSSLPFYAGFLWVLGPQRRAWHDRFAGTEVAYVKPQRTDTRTVNDLRRRIRGSGRFVVE